MERRNALAEMQSCETNRYCVTTSELYISSSEIHLHSCADIWLHRLAEMAGARKRRSWLGYQLEARDQPEILALAP